MNLLSFVRFFCLGNLFVGVVFINLLKAQNEAKMLRFPHINSTHIVFSYAGDLYLVSKNGGIARKITSHIGNEFFPRFSPDGRWLAFSAQYDGNTEVYVMPAEGGVPKRLTYTPTLSRDDLADRMGPNNIVMTWKNDNKSIIYRSRKQSFNDFKGQLFIASIDGGTIGELPFSVGGFCSFSPDNQKIAYNRVFREFRTWKYYQGGMADDIWVYDFATEKTQNITNHRSQDIFPMWYQNKIYFLSDRDRRMNLFVYDIDTKTTKKLTHFTDFDIKFPALGANGIIVFEKGGEIYTFDCNTEKYQKVTVYIQDDLNSPREQLVDASKNIMGYDLSPDGNRVVFNARGELFTVPAQKGVTRHIFRSAGSHERSPVWSPNGKYIAFISDRTGEDEIYILPQEGGIPIQLTSGGDTYKYRIIWSPDSRKILWSDKKNRLLYVDIETKKTTLVTQSQVWEITSFAFSPDSRWIAYAENQWQSKTRIFLYSVEEKKSEPITEEWYDSTNPVFSSDGKYLFFVSNRDFNPIYSATEWNHAYVDMAKIYILPLQKDTPHPFPPQNDEVKVNIENKIEEKKEEKKVSDAKSSKVIRVDWEGILSRSISLPIAAGNYYNLQVSENKVYYFYRTYKDKRATLKVFDLETKQETELGQWDNFILSLDGKKILLADKNSFSVQPVPTPFKGGSQPLAWKDPIDLSGLVFLLDKKQEWKQIYWESWRQMRDFFYAPNLHGVNWRTIGEHYATLLPYINHRNDLTYLIGELIGELNCGHAYVGGGDRPSIPMANMGMLGAQFEKSQKYGYFQVKKVLKGANWNPKLRSPLSEIGVEVKEGDYIIAINGQPTNELADIYMALINTAGKTVEILVNKEPTPDNARKVLVTPIEDESQLYYYDWVQTNIEKVAKATNNQVGYLHIPDMGPEGLNEFVKYFYPQLNKKALIIDDRGNGGGNVSPMIIERLRRELDMVLIARNSKPTTSPAQMLLGPKVCLIDQYSASDGDLFPWRFKYYKLGTVIGVRSWGGTVGIRGSLPFVDGGNLSKPEFSRYDVNGKEWIIEGYGVDPDIEVRNDPALEYKGIDEQLNKAIEVILEKLKTEAKELPPPPPYPER
ncbi:MAG: PDZ domain-containing protein [Bacteroidia bacterium]|nr:PDZ domain-containing protein [Bacteroidia bacterium]MDW8157371.1 PDZ domain-containing protein [Bacteroidia bacterium]